MKFTKSAILCGLLVSVPAIAQNVRGAGHYTDRSGTKVSGECANDSDWYILTTPPIASGLSITNFRYHLEGDRSCGAWSKCEVAADSPVQKSVRFNMQGHSEFCGVINSIGHPNTGTAESEMVFDYDVQ